MDRSATEVSGILHTLLIDGQKSRFRHRFFCNAFRLGALTQDESVEGGFFIA